MDASSKEPVAAKAPPLVVVAHESTEIAKFFAYVLQDHFGVENYHALKHSLFKHLTRHYGISGGRRRYYLLKLFLHPWEWISTRVGGGSHLGVCAERPPA